MYVTISNRSICYLPAFLRFLCVRLLVPWRVYEFHVYAVMMQRVRILMSALNWACPHDPNPEHPVLFSITCAARSFHKTRYPASSTEEDCNRISSVGRLFGNRRRTEWRSVGAAACSDGRRGRRRFPPYQAAATSARRCCAVVAAGGSLNRTPFCSGVCCRTDAQQMRFCCGPVRC